MKFVSIAFTGIQ